VLRELFKGEGDASPAKLRLAAWVNAAARLTVSLGVLTRIPILHLGRSRDVTRQRAAALTFCLLAVMNILGQVQALQGGGPPEVPKTWEAEAIASVEIPLALTERDRKALIAFLKTL
jgi:hypothetical protein